MSCCEQVKTQLQDLAVNLRCSRVGHSTGWVASPIHASGKRHRHLAKDLAEKANVGRIFAQIPRPVAYFALKTPYGYLAL